MRRTAVSALMALVILAAMALSSGVALAGWVYEDCPPASTVAREHRSPTATAIVDLVEPPEDANDHAWNSNPGKKW